MTFKITMTKELSFMLENLSKRNRQLGMEIRKKMEQICALDEVSIDHFKNLKHGLSDWKRVHVGKSFILFFTVYKKEGIVLFQKLAHHDDAYRR